MKLTLLATTVFILMLASVGCNRTKTYTLQGEVRGKDLSTNEVTVHHGDIPGFMPSMTMPYKVKDPAVLQELQPGDKIAADIVFSKDGNDYWLEDVRITDESNRGKIKDTTGPHMLMPGEKIPDVPMVNQDGKTIHITDFAGKAVLVTFIYTRCPMPTFCPRLSSQFAKIHNELKKDPADYGKTHLLTISFDPKYDKPTVLRKYGLAYLDGDATGFSQWDFAATTEADLPRLAQAFGLTYEAQGNQISHTMNIALINPDGTEAKFWSTNWTWDELLKDLRQAAHQPVKG
jgi:protein SCO1